MKRAGVSLFVLLLLASTAHARTWYVVPDSTGDAPTVQAAIDSSSTGDTVLVAAGLYYVNLKILAKTDLTLKSESGPELTFLDGTYADPGAPARYQVVRAYQSDNLLIEGFTIQNGHPNDFHDTGGAGILVGGARATIRGNVIRNNTNEEGNGSAVCLGSNVAGTVIEGNSILENVGGTCGGVRVRYDSGSPIYIQDNLFSGNSGQNAAVYIEGSSTLVKGNVIAQNVCNGTNYTVRSLYASFRAEGNLVYGNVGGGIVCINGYIVENTVVDNDRWGIGAIECTEVRNNIAVGNGIGGIGSADCAGVQCNDSWGNSEFDYYFEGDVDSVANFSINPLFCNPDAGDYSIASESPCAPENSGECGLIGALDVGCTATSVPAGSKVPTSWGRVKSLFR